MGGTIDVSSEVDKGSLFRVELECRIPEKQTDMQFWEKNGISRIMLVDSDEQSNKDIQTLMENEGLRLTHSSMRRKQYVRLRKGTTKKNTR